MANKNQNSQLKSGHPQKGWKSGADETPELKTWKDHPWVVALGTGAATIIFCVTVFMTVVVPTYTKQAENKIDELQRQVAVLSKDRDERAEVIKNLTSKAIEKPAESARRTEDVHPESSTQLEDPNLVALFTDGDPYPRPLRKIRIGDSIERVASEFGSGVTAEANWYSVDLTTTPFSGVTYYEDSKKKVDSILFLTRGLSDQDKKTSNAMIRSQLVEAFGQPDAIAPDGNNKVRFCWRRKRTDFSIYSAGLSIASANSGKLTCPP